jgi:predicted PurR-regulated permease PerM
VTTSPPASLPVEPPHGRLPVRVVIARIKSVSLPGLFVLAVFYTLYLGRIFFLPMVLAFFIAMLLRPAVRRLKRIRVPPSLGAALVLLAGITLASTAVYQLSGPAAEWAARAPEDLGRIQAKARELMQKIGQLTQTAHRVEQMTQGPGPNPPEVLIRQPGGSLLAAAFGGAKNLVFLLLITLVLTYFFLASGDDFVRKLPRVLPRRRADRILAIVQAAEGRVSRYLVAVSVINICLGIITAGLMALFRMPTPLLLGAVAALLNFVPYLGPSVMVVLLALIALLTDGHPGTILAPPLCYLALHALEANFITPRLLGWRLPLNPTVIFVGFVFWWWLWGAAGALLAVPILVTLKTVCDGTESLSGLGEVLGR